MSTRCPTVATIPSPFKVTNIWNVGSALSVGRSVTAACDEVLLSGQTVKVGLLPGGPKVIPPNAKTGR